MSASPRDRIESWVLEIHRRNGGQLRELDFTRPFLAPESLLDSLDLAEIFARVEREYAVQPMECERPPRTWEELAKYLTT